MTMVQVDCPWCDGPAIFEPIDGGEAIFQCEECAVRVEATTASPVEMVAIAA